MPASPVRLARKAPRFAWSRSVRALNASLDRLETRSDAGDTPLPHAPILVLGAPRSGSTLLYQLLVDRFDVGYLSNLHCRLYGAPSLVERVAQRIEPPNSAYESTHGRTAGLLAPSECGEYWYRFFRRSPQYVPLSAAPPESLRRLRASIRALVEASDRPVVFKNLLCSLRVAPIGAALPEALFLVIHRDVAANAQSLLAARRRIHGDDTRWWSAEPPDVDRLRSLPPREQVVEQIRSIERVIASDRLAAGEHRFHDVSYEALCERTHVTLDEIAAFTARNGTRLERRREVPERFSPAGARA